ncbi:AbrB/MazE/SpoVT family DNA-binding domain-containing protein [Planctomycetota bacterium]
MTTSSVTTKGQVTIPKKIRDQLHLKSGDKVDFILEKDGSARMLPVSQSIDSIVGIVKADRKLSAEEMNAAISKRANKGRT